MATTTFDHSLAGYESRTSGPSVLTNFMAWCTAQEHNRLFWLGLALTIHGCVLTPITVLLLALTGVNIFLITTAMVAMTMVLVSNLAALPTKYTIPVFVISVLMDIAVIIIAFSKFYRKRQREN